MSRPPPDAGDPLAGFAQTSISTAGDISALLSAHSQLGAEGALDSTDLAVSDPAAQRWEVRGELGLGGMGRVILAHDRWLGRDIALKEPRTQADHARLRREAIITARLEHPGILPVYDIGLSPTGLPWFAMRLVRGTSLADALAANPPLTERLRLLRPLLGVCETIAFAHDRGVVHRDLKPANIMLGSFGEALVIDWGLASEAATADTITPSGTPRYMSPEQARGAAPDPQHDVFSLGLILFECLSGEPLRPPSAPDLRIKQPGAAPDRPPSLPSEVPPELSAIVHRAIAAPTDRYPDAKSLARDLDNYLDGARVSAHTYSALELLVRFVRASRAPLAVAAIALLVLVTLVIVGTNEIRTERDLAKDSLASSLTSAAARSLTVDARADAEVMVAHSIAHHPMPESLGVLAQIPVARPTITRLGPIPCEPLDLHADLMLCRTDATLMLMRDLELVWEMPITPAHRVAFLPDGKRFATADRVDLIVYDTFTRDIVRGPVKYPVYAPFNRAVDGRSLTYFTPQYGVRLRASDTTTISGAPCGKLGFSAMALAEDGETWAVGCHDGRLLLGSYSDPIISTLIEPHPNRLMLVIALSFVPGRDEILLGTPQGSVIAFDLVRREMTLIASGEGFVHQISVDEAGKKAIIQRDVGAPLIVDIAARASLGRVPKTAPTTVAAHAPGGNIVVGGLHLERWNFDRVMPRSIQFADGLATISASADGRRIGVAHGRSVSVYDTTSRTLIRRESFDGWLVKDLAFSVDGQALVLYHFGEGGLLNLDLEAPAAAPVNSPIDFSVRRLVVLADGSIVRSAHTGFVSIHRATAPHDTIGDKVLDTSARALVVSPDGRHLGALDDSSTLYLVTDLHLSPRGTRLTPCGHLPGARAVAVDNDGDELFVARTSSVAVACGPGSETTYAAPGAQLTSVAASAHSIVAGSHDGAVWVWRRGTPGVHLLARPHEARVSEVAIDPSERWIASGSWDGRLVFIDPARALTTPIPSEVESAWGLALADIIGTRSRSAPSTPER